MGDDDPEEICFLGSFKEETSDTDDDYSLVVGTTTTAGTVSKKFEFTSGGNFIPSDDDSQDLGSSSNRWDDVFATNGTIQTSDERQKQDFETITEAEKKVATVLKGKLKKYRFKDAVTSKGESEVITLLGGKGITNDPKKISLGGLDFYLKFGSLAFELPFAITLNDFII